MLHDIPWDPKTHPWPVLGSSELDLELKNKSPFNEDKVNFGSLRFDVTPNVSSVTGLHPYQIKETGLSPNQLI